MTDLHQMRGMLQLARASLNAELAHLVKLEEFPIFPGLQGEDDSGMDGGFGGFRIVFKKVLRDTTGIMHIKCYSNLWKGMDARLRIGVENCPQEMRTAKT